MSDKNKDKFEGVKIKYASNKLGVSCEEILDFFEEGGYVHVVTGRGPNNEIVDREAYRDLCKEYGDNGEERGRERAPTDRDSTNNEAEQKSGSGSTFQKGSTDRKSEGPNSWRASKTVTERFVDQGESLRSRTCVCGSEDVDITGKNQNLRSCSKCNRTWYVNHCWSCNQHIDSRSSKASRCSSCGWYRCPSCGSCEWSCDQESAKSEHRSCSPDGLLSKALQIPKTDGADESAEDSGSTEKHQKESRSAEEKRSRLSDEESSSDSEDAFAHIDFSTTGAEQVIRAIDGSAKVPDDDRRCRERGGRLLQEYARETDTIYIARMEDTDRDTGRSKVNLRLQHEDESISLVLTPKPECVLVLGARPAPARERTYEIEADLRLLVGSNGKPPISRALWDRIQELETRQARREEVESRLEQWKAYLRVRREKAEEKQFETAYHSIRHLEQHGRVRIGLEKKSRQRILGRLKDSHRDRISIYTENPEENERIRAIAQATVVRYDESQHCLIADLSDEDVERLENDSLQIPPRGWIQHKAVGTLSMVHREENAIERLKQTGGAMEDLDLFLFGSDEEIDPPPFGPVEPIPKSECLDPEHTNEKQRLAVANALECPDMFFLQGPPGTGKTTFIAELCYQLGRRGKRALVASQANLAVDNALGRLQKSRDILAVRVAREDKVEDEGKPFVEENAVRTWLRGVAGHAQKRIETQKNRLDALELVRSNRETLRGWIEESSNLADQISKLRDKKTKHEDQVNSFRDDSDRKHDLAGRLESLASSLSSESVLQNEVGKEVDVDLKQMWQEIDASIREKWSRTAEEVCELTSSKVKNPWEAGGALHRMSGRLQPGNEISEMVNQAQDAVAEVRPLHIEIKDKAEDLSRASSSLDDLRSELYQIKSELRSITEEERRTSVPDQIDPERFPKWHAVASRVAKAHSLIAGTRGRKAGPSPVRSASELSEAWRKAEISGREEDAEHLLEKLHLAIDEERKKRSSQILGWFHRFWKPNLFSKIENEVIKVKNNITEKRVSEISKIIEKEIRKEKKEIKEKLSNKEREIERRKKEVRGIEEDLENLKKEATVEVDRLHGKFKPLIPEEELKDESVVDRFLKVVEALENPSDRLECLRRKVSQQREEIKTTLQEIQGKIRSEAEKYRKEARELEKKAERREKAAASVNDRIEDLFERHAEAREVWNQVCEKDPDLTEVSAHSPPTTKWIEEYIDAHKNFDSKRIQREQEIVKDWEDAITSGEETISETLKERFYRNANVVGATCARAGKKDFRGEYGVFDVVIIDEVSKATPTELLMPSLQGAKVALVGDHRQLAPVFGHQSNFEAAADQLGMEKENLRDNLQRSLFKERFEYFADVEDSREGRGSSGQRRQGQRTLMLTKQYRMHSQIMEGINQFYDEKLELGQLPDQSENLKPLDHFRDHRLDIEPWVRSDRHLVWVDTPVGEEWEHTQEGPTRYNEKETKTTMKMLREVADTFRGRKNFDLSVGVTSVYAAQVQKLRSKVQQMSIPPRMEKDLKISTVDRFQGMERDIMFLNLVLNRKNHPPSKWLRTPERINVAMSRARRLLVIVGSKHNYVEVDKTSPAYKRFFDVARRHGHYVRANLVLS